MNRKKAIYILLGFTSSCTPSNLNRDVVISENVHCIKNYAYKQILKEDINFNKRTREEQLLILKNKILEILEYPTDKDLTKEVLRFDKSVASEEDLNRLFKDYGVNWVALLSLMYENFGIISSIIIKGNELYLTCTDESNKENLKAFHVLHEFIIEGSNENFLSIQETVALLDLGMKALTKKTISEENNKADLAKDFSKIVTKIESEKAKKLETNPNRFEKEIYEIQETSNSNQETLLNVLGFPSNEESIVLGRTTYLLLGLNLGEPKVAELKKKTSLLNSDDFKNILYTISKKIHAAFLAEIEEKEALKTIFVNIQNDDQPDFIKNFQINESLSKHLGDKNLPADIQNIFNSFQ